MLEKVKTEISRVESETIGGNNGLDQYLLSLAVGRQSTPHSWLYEKEDANKTLKRWIPLMKKGNSKSNFSETFNSFDLAQVKKFGPQGAIPPFDSKEVEEVIEPLYSSTEYDDSNALMQWRDKAHEFGKMVFRNVKRCRPLTFEQVIEDMRRRGTLVTNSGYPRFTRRSRVIEQEVQDAVAGRAYDYPAIILFRFYYQKLRPVWMFPMSMNLIENSFQIQIQRALQDSPLDWVKNYLQPWAGYEFVKKQLTKQWHGQQVDGGDTTKMDAHMRPAQLMLVFEIVKWLFQEKYWAELQKCMLHVNTIDLLVSDKFKLQGVHGLASGSGWTQLSETVLQLFMAYNAQTEGQGIGDDFYWLSSMDAQELVNYLAKFGLPANSAKQSIANNELTFLQRLNHQGFFSREDDKVLGAYYPTIRALGSMLWPEKFHKPKEWSSDMFCIRNYTILENCVDDPCFDEFLSFVIHGHKDMIPFAKQSARKLKRIQQIARQVSGLFPSYNQEKRDKPLSSYVSIQLAKNY